MEFEQVYRSHYKNVFNYICFRINNHFDAEDLTCAVFEKAIVAWGKYNPDFSAEAWLIGIAKNTVTDYFRAKGRRTFVGLESVLGLVYGGRQPDEIAVANEENRDLISAMSRLKERERQILALKFATDLKHNEIAELLRISQSNVGAIAHRALKKQCS
ncbi:MAG: sigma-70 family RNA polymerase sigma factor [Defluviitaleaceae bacterium]|nr:sigma-70 family RNA polymerase sigma factor [Defluviitaleaceae bacterium]MCL2263164.1 sigma-70 family RNA polymerase sigma factor [Defluviitaleaceae bacterium]